MVRRFKRRSVFLLSILLALTNVGSGTISTSASTPSSFSASDYNYAEALQKSIYFYETQRSGKLPETNRVEWRGDSGLQDGSDVGVDLTGGWYDAGDHVKFGFPMAATATMLAWSVYEYREGYENAGQLDAILDNIRWATDYFIKAHTAPNELWGQVGNGTADHNWWGPAEVMPMARPAYKIDAANPGSDLAGETAAALASSSIIFADSDPAYSALLLQHAKELYQFADQYRGKYSDSITDAQAYYNSWSGYADELSWAAIWLYLATDDEDYLDDAIAASNDWGTNQQGDWDHKWTHAWDDKHYGAQLLLARITNEPRFVASTEKNMQYWSTGVAGTGERINYTPGGLAYLDTWGALRYSANQAFLSFVYSDWVSDPVKKQAAKTFAESQILYMLGDNPRQSSYVIGYGNNSPEHPHHRTSHGSWSDSQTQPANHRHILYGALVGGPSVDDSYTDSINDFVSNEVATDYNAGFTGALAKMMIEHGDGNMPLASFPQPEVRDDEMFVEASVNASGSNFIEIKALLNNRSGWPARASSSLSFKYFIDLSELIAAGYSPQDVTVTAGGYNQGATVSQLLPFDAANHIYYTEADFTGTRIYPGGQSAFRKEVQFRISAPLQTTFWDNTNDFSYQGLPSAGSTPVKTPYIPVYEAGSLVFGEQPTGGTPGIPTAPVAPKGVTAIAGDKKVQLTWSAVSGADAYIVKRSEVAGGPYTEIAVVSTSSYTDSDLTNGTAYHYVIAAQNSVGEGPNSNQVSATPKELPAPVEGDLELQYRVLDSQASDNQIRAQFRIFNHGEEAIPLSQLTFRYYYTIDGDKPQQFHCDYAAVGSSNVTGTFVSMPVATGGADYYVEVSFGAGAGSLAPGDNTGDIQVRMNKSDWTNYNELDDYSYDATKTSYTTWDKVTIYQNNTLVWGIEP